MQKIIRIWDTLLVVLLMSISLSCGDKEETDSPLTLSVKPTTPAEIPAKGGDIEFTVATNASEWKYTLSNDWLTEKAKTNTTLTLEASANTAESQRAITVTFSLPSSPNTKQSIVLSQAGTENAPKADLIDLVFKTDGTAENVASPSIRVTNIKGGGLSTIFSTTYNRYIARFSHGGSATSSGYYKVDYSSNQKFKDAIANGHTMETFCMLDMDKPLPDQEFKMFSAHEGGGTGFLIGNNARNNSFVFLPHIGSGYVWANSGVSPERGKYYHIVGVWNKEEGKVYIYVDGALKATENASGNFNFPAAASQWFGIGVDASAGGGQTGWQGDVAIARLYDKPLTSKEVQLLWGEVKDFTPDPNGIQITEASLSSKRVLAEGKYIIKGKGFESGDKIRLEPTSGSSKEYVCNGEVAENSFTISLPKEFTTGEYRFFVVRGEKEMDLGFATLTIVDKLPEMPKVIAHRGYWNSQFPQNSVAALKNAQRIGIYGAEFDVWITKDGRIVLNHDATINGINIEKSTYDQLKDIKLSNGEKLPTLEDYLEQAKEDPSTKLILEIKSHSDITTNHRAATEAHKLVQASGIADQVEYIAFSMDVCKKIIELQPDATVAYLNGTSSPQQLKDLGLHMDYNIGTIRANKNWVAQMQSLGKTVNVWTVNSSSDISEMIDLGVNYITTDLPELAKQLIENY